MLEQWAGSGAERLRSDPTSVLAATRNSLDQDPRLIFGRVVDSIPYANVYKVLPERGLPVTLCTYSGGGPIGPIGTRGLGTLPPRTAVWFVYHTGQPHGEILFAVPDFGTDGSKSLSDWIFLGGRSGFFRDTAYSYPFLLNSAILGDFSSGRPMDATTGGEIGGMSTTGMRYFVDHYMAQLGCGESCGFLACLHDELVRMVGMAMQIRSLSTDWENLDDEGELYDILSSFVYPWERMGAPRPGVKTYEEHDAATTQIEKPHLTPIEPVNSDQISIARRLDVRGYLGQGGKRIVQAPTGEELWRYGGENEGAILFEEDIAITGAYGLRSAKSVSIVKTAWIPMITPKRRPEDPRGDSSTTYKASSQYGSGSDHVVKGGPRAPSSNPHLARTAALRDQHAYLFNWEFPHPFVLHKEDWGITEESGTQMGQGVVPDASVAANHNKMYLPPPSTKSLRIDHRYGDVEYALSSASINITDDGSIILLDAYGSGIIMTGGAIVEAPAVDHWVRAPRNANVWAGRDVNTRARNHVDISSTTKDVRIKSERHLQLLAGNSGANGAVLIESKAPTPSYVFEDGAEAVVGDDVVAGGVMIRSLQDLVTWSESTYVRTMNGAIVLDAAKGAGLIECHSQSFVNFLAGGGASFNAYREGEAITHVHISTATATLVDGGLYVLQYGAFGNSVYSNGSVLVDNGHIFTSRAAQGFLNVGGLQPGSLKEFFQTLTSIERQLQATLTSTYGSTIQDSWYGATRPGNDRVMQFAHFAFRTPEQYGSTNFHIFEDFSQQTARIAGQGEIWRETPVVVAGRQTAPYPGYEMFDQNGTYFEMDLRLVDADTGNAKPRKTDGNLATAYLSPELATPRAGSLNSNYRVLG